MAHLKFRNVNDAFFNMVHIFANKDSQHRRIPHSTLPIAGSQSRNGPVLQIMQPVILTYEKPLERVLFNQARDCNPFLHLFESLWMLAGRNDVAPLAYYAPNMVNYSDDGVTLNGAYGYRWRRAKVAYNWEQEKAGLFARINEGPNSVDCEVDQLKVIISHLKQKPESRRAVLHMSNVEDDLVKMDTTKDQCCNTQVMFSICQTPCTYCRGGVVDVPPTEPYPQAGLRKLCDDCKGTGYSKRLDMTVINRSNDLVWGCLGANYVHFSFLQEYMAANIGVEVGVYNQVSNNLHIYTENNSGFKHEEWLADNTDGAYDYVGNNNGIVPLIRDPAVFEKELPLFVENSIKHSGNFHVNWKEPFLQSVATPLLWAFELYKKRDYVSTLSAIKECAADDWRIAGTNWLMKRKLSWEAKERERNHAL